MRTPRLEAQGDTAQFERQTATSLKLTRYQLQEEVNGPIAAEESRVGLLNDMNVMTKSFQKLQFQKKSYNETTIM